ncbi:MAG: hypothetical protein ACTSQ9_01780 [Candidatus Hodarchaeales archaeon]
MKSLFSSAKLLPSQSDNRLTTQGEQIWSIQGAESLCDRVGIIDRGTLIALDTPQALMEEYDYLADVFLSFSVFN